MRVIPTQQVKAGQPMATKLHNCVNCGAVLTSSFCEYCGTRYDEEMPVEGSFSYIGEGTITIGGETFRCYVGNIEVTPLCVRVGRELDGTMHRPETIYKRKFTLIEV